MTDNFSKLKIGNNSINLNDKKVIDLINQYNRDHNMQPIFLNNEENISKLKNSGKKFTTTFLSDFAFLTLNRYDIVEPITNINDYLSDESLIKFLKENLKLVKDAIVKDYVRYDLNWFNKKWKKGLKTHSSRYDNIRSIYKEVVKEDPEFGKKIYEVMELYDTDTKNHDYAWVKESLKYLFETYASDISKEEISRLENMVLNQYNKIYNKNLKKYSDLPLKEWREKYTPIINQGNVPKLKNELYVSNPDINENFKKSPISNKLFGTKTELEKISQEAFGCSYNDLEGLKKYAEKNYADYPENVAKAINQAFEKCLNKKINLFSLKKFVEKISLNIDAYKTAEFKKWFTLSKEEEEDNEERQETFENIQRDAEKYHAKFSSNSKAENLWNKYKPQLDKKFLNYEWDQETYEEKLTILIKNCLSSLQKWSKSAIPSVQYLNSIGLKYYTDTVERESSSPSFSNYEKGIQSLSKTISSSVCKPHTNEIVEAIKKLSASDFISLIIQVSGKNLENVIKILNSVLNLSLPVPSEEHKEKTSKPVEGKKSETASSSGEAPDEEEPSDEESE